MSIWNKKWAVRGASLVLAGACLFGGAVLAAGDEDDPLITLSYLEQTVVPEVLEEVEANAAIRQEELEEQFRKEIDQYQQRLDQTQQTQGGSETYTVVTLARDQQMLLGVGCEVMLRVGSAVVSSNTEPALIDISGGGKLGSGGSLVQNHLYMATIADRYLTATADTVKVLVRGGYTIY